ncbi:MAG: trehalose-phosphatase [Elusimicrobia bacterium]|nr:trehalose-phosphatase [Elusimicrobiota bacterium]
MRPFDLGKLRAAAGGRPVSLFLDFDGTLSPHVPDGDLAAPLPEAREALAALARTPGVRVSVVSGRPVADLSRMVALKGVTYAGNHGLVIEGPGVEFEHPLSMVAGRAVAVAEGLIRERLKGHPGARVRQNGLTLSLNVGLMSASGRRAVARVVDSLTDELRWLRLRWQKGYLGWDLIPEIGWTKGDAVAHLMARTPDAFAIAIGDGLSDEPMFERVRADGLAVRVGRARSSAADWFLSGPADVAGLLHALARPR